MVGYAMRVVCSHVLHAEFVDEQFGELVHARHNLYRSCLELRISRHASGFPVVVPNHGDTGSRRGANNFILRECLDELADQRDRFTLVSRVVVHLTATGLFGTKSYLMSEPLQNANDGNAGVRKQQIVVTGDKKRDTHSK